MRSGRADHVLGAQDIGADGLHRKKLARRDLLQRGGMKHAIHPGHRPVDAVPVADVADIVADVRTAQRGAHHVLLFLVAAEYANLGTALFEQILQHRLAKRPGAAGNENGI